MSECKNSPEKVFDRLINEANDIRRRRSLDAINQVCMLLRQRGSKDFSYKNIVMLGQDRSLSVPSEKSIVNSTGEHYRELIQAWRPEKFNKAVLGEDASEGWVRNIKDPVLRMRVSLNLKEIQALKKKEARKATSNAGPLLIGKFEGATSMLADLNGAEIAALKSAIDPQVLRLHGFSIGGRGEIIDPAGKKIQKPGFCTAIEKILSVQVR